MIKELNDSLDDLLGRPAGEVRQAVNAPADYVPGAAPLIANRFKETKEYTEPCRKCRGTGRYAGPSSHGSRCFECDGAGSKTFRTSPEQRSKARASANARKAKVEQVSVEGFKAAHPAIFEWLVATAPRWDLAASYLASVHRFGSLTEKQMEVAQKSIDRDVARAKEREEKAAAAPTIDTAGVDRLKLAFDTAIANARAKGRGLKMPRITIGGVVISPAKETSANAGALYVKQAGQYLGKIKGGRFFSVRDCTEDQEKRVLAFVADPKAAAIAYGKETGVCCICNATLTNKASIEAGIGPICATKFGW